MVIVVWGSCSLGEVANENNAKMPEAPAFASLMRPSRDSFFNNNIGHSCLLYQTSHTRIYSEVVFIVIFHCVVLLYALILNSCAWFK